MAASRCSWAAPTFFLAMTLLCGLAQSMPQLIVLRTLQGLGGGVHDRHRVRDHGPAAGAGRARAHQRTDHRRLQPGGRRSDQSSAAISTDTFTWRAVFYVNLPFALLALVVLWRFFPQVAYSGRRLPIDFGGAITSVGGIVLLLLALSLGGREFAWDVARGHSRCSAAGWPCWRCSCGSRHVRRTRCCR